MVNKIKFLIPILMKNLKFKSKLVYIQFSISILKRVNFSEKKTARLARMVNASKVRPSHLDNFIKFSINLF
jgi:hypothetical protein